MNEWRAKVRLKGFYSLNFTNVACAVFTLGLFACSSAPSVQISNEDQASYDAASEALEPLVESPQEALATMPPDIQSKSAPRPHLRSTWAAKAIRVQAKPFDSGDYSMNSFYFVRSENENWQSISTLLYGRPDRAQVLQSWNSSVSALKVGQVLYYNSASRPEDRKEMKPFALDFGAQLSSIVVKQGDTLSGLAKQNYGSFDSWKEISALNPQLANPNLIQVGQVLYLQPTHVDTASYFAALVDQFEQAEKSNDLAPEAETFDDSLSESVNAATPPIADAPIAEAPVVVPSPQANLATPAAAAKLDPSELYLRVGVLIIAFAVIGLIVARVRRRKAEQKRLQEEQIHNFPGRTGTDA